MSFLVSSRRGPHCGRVAFATGFAAFGGTLQVKAPAKHTDFYGLEAALSGICASADDVVVAELPLINGVFSSVRDNSPAGETAYRASHGWRKRH